MAIMLAGCSNLNPMNWFDGDESEQPAELLEITQEVDVRQRWSVNVGNGQGDQYILLTPAVDGDVIYAAAENGAVVAVETNSGVLFGEIGHVK